MLTILSFLIMMIGGINWLLIGLLQYDFVAGIFGYQGSVFSRIIYIIIGIANIIFFIKVIKGKGTVNIFSRRNKKDLQKNLEKMQKDSQESSESTPENAYSVTANVSNGKEEGLLNEHIKD